MLVMNMVSDDTEDDDDAPDNDDTNIVETDTRSKESRLSDTPTQVYLSMSSLSLLLKPQCNILF